MTKCAELLNRTIEVDFVDINVGCPIDLVYKKVVATWPWASTLWGGQKPGTWPCSRLWLWGPVGATVPWFPHLDSEGREGGQGQPASCPLLLQPTPPHPRFSQGGGCALMNRSAKFQQIVRGMNQVRAWTPSPTPPPTP